MDNTQLYPAEVIQSFFINLPQRVDRLKEFKEELKWINGITPFLMEGVIDKPAHKGIGQAHTNCIWYANEVGWDKVLIMEDDCVFQGEDKTYPYLLEAMDNLPEDWDILLGGLYNKARMQPFNDWWNKVDKFCGLHFYYVNKKAYEKILTYDGLSHFDNWLGQQGLNIYVTKKFIAHQRDGWSDNVGMITKYNDEHLDKSKLLK